MRKHLKIFMFMSLLAFNQLALHAENQPRLPLHYLFGISACVGTWVGANFFIMRHNQSKNELKQLNSNLSLLKKHKTMYTEFANKKGFYAPNLEDNQSFRLGSDGFSYHNNYLGEISDVLGLSSQAQNDIMKTTFIYGKLTNTHDDTKTSINVVEEWGKTHNAIVQCNQAITKQLQQAVENQKNLRINALAVGITAAGLTAACIEYMLGRHHR